MFAYCGNNPVNTIDPCGYWDLGWEEQLLLGTTVLVVGLALLFAPPTGGGSLAAGAAFLSSTTMLTAGATVTVAGTVIIGESLRQANLSYAKKSRKSNKERSTNKPSWVHPNDVDPNKSAQENAKEIMNGKYGTTWPKGTREYSQIVKWITRCLRDLAIAFMVDWWEE